LNSREFLQKCIDFSGFERFNRLTQRLHRMRE
jgi:hypothetical protein